MKLQNKTVIVTGAAQGIGKALAIAFKDQGAQVVASDLLAEQINATAQEIGVTGIGCDVTNETDIQNLVSATEKEYGPVDLFCSNAGVFYGQPDHAASADNNTWQKCWEIHVMSHVYAARAVLPSMIERGQGYLLQMASAAGLLNQIGDAAYSTTKHAAVGFAESLAITHGDEGIKVSVICPQYVATPMLGYKEGDQIEEYKGLITTEQVAQTVVTGIDKEQFLILPHAEVEQYIKLKAGDYDRWLGGMRKLRRKIGNSVPQDIHKLMG